MKTFSFALAFCILSGVASRAVDPIRLVHRWEQEPDLGTSWQEVPPLFTPIIRPDRFSSPLQIIRLNEAQSAIRNADNRRLQGGEQSLPVLLEQLRSLPKNRPARMSLAAAAIALAKPDHSEQLWERLRNDEATRPLIERALIDWKLPLGLENWRKRLRNDIQESPDLLLAIEGIGATGNRQDQKGLEALLRNDSCSIAMKLVIARALARVAPSGLESLATDVWNTNIEHRELLAAELLSHHTSDSARDILMRVVKADHLPAQRAAYDSIAKNFPVLAREQAGDMLRRPDNRLRLIAVEVLNAHDDVDSLRLQAVGLEDRNTLVRNTVRENMIRKAMSPHLRPVVDEVITYQLRGKSQEAIKQAIKLAVALQQTEHCPQLLSLLEYPQAETTVFAAWALQELAVAPEVIEGIYKFTEPTTQRLKDRAGVSELEILRQSFLFEALGRNLYKPATNSLKLYIPKDNHKMGRISRASAIWALGKILRGSQDEGLAKQLAERMNDEDYALLEFNLVRYNATVALGWIGASSSLDDLKRVPYTPPEPLGISCKWALEQFQASSETNR